MWYGLNSCAVDTNYNFHTGPPTDEKAKGQVMERDSWEIKPQIFFFFLLLFVSFNDTSIMVFGKTLFKTFLSAQYHPILLYILFCFYSWCEG